MSNIFAKGSLLCSNFEQQTNNFSKIPRCLILLCSTLCVPLFVEYIRCTEIAVTEFMLVVLITTPGEIAVWCSFSNRASYVLILWAPTLSSLTRCYWDLFKLVGRQWGGSLGTCSSVFLLFLSRSTNFSDPVIDQTWSFVWVESTWNWWVDWAGQTFLS